LRLLSHSFHHKAVTSLDVCQRKPIVATAGLDCSIRVWNYVDNTLELSRYFSEEIFSLALHPSGLFLLAGFGDKLRLLNLLMDDIRPVREFSIRECKECRFSQGGHMFAAAQGNIIQVRRTERAKRNSPMSALSFPTLIPHISPNSPVSPALLHLDLSERGQPQGPQRPRAVALLVGRRHQARVVWH
jgi:WD40 repeat protein